MAETKIEIVAEPVETPVEEKPSRFKNFTLNHPRTAKVVAVVGITAATLGAIQVWKSRKQDPDLTEDDDSDEPFETSSEITS